MLLSVDRLSTQVDTIRTDVELLRSKIIADKGEEAAAKIFSQHCEPLNRLRNNIASKKTLKFDRDANDYLQNRVYSWREDQYRAAEGNYRQCSRGNYWMGPPAPQRYHRQSYRPPLEAAQTEMRASSSSDDYSPSPASQPFLEVDTREQRYPPKRQYRNPRAPIPRERYPQRTHQKVRH
ncbi:hypothetical protein XELAEV_18047195mg [Xenopus laevis]|uniref:Uncharacterized protein n=1 Tax=Xenopus laevis TaxID=8355 RepID=A0A974H1B1_XENLA|nr:hypothetical protein XELAEV_18047195mg [Xenopus laevis]